MIFKIADGREYFYQWDIDRQIIVSDPTIKEVHFCNRTDVCSLVVEVVDGVANVPNKVLQSGFDVRVFGYDGKATMHETTFEVKARTQPTDYVYTEVEIKRYSDLEKRIDEIEKNGISEEVINSAVSDYLEEHPVDMTGYPTKNYVDAADYNLNLLLTQHNHDGYYATKNHTHSDYTTKTYVDNAVKNVKVDVDLTDYAKKTDIPDTSKFITSIPSEYVTEAELEAKKYATKTELNSKANTNHTHSTADVDGLQKTLNEKATQADIDKAIELHDHRYDYAPIEHSHGDEYAAKTHVHSYNSLLDKPTIPSVEGLASEAYVDSAIKNIDIPEVDFTGYATEKYVTEAINALGPVTSNMEYVTTQNNADDIIAIIKAGKWPVLKQTAAAALITYTMPLIQKTTKEIVFAQIDNTGNLVYNKYLINEAKWENVNYPCWTKIQTKLDVNPAATTETLTGLTIDGVSYAIEAGTDVDLSNYYTKAETEALIPDVSDFISEIPAEYVTETELEAKGYLTEHQSLAGLATEEFVNNAIANIDIPEGESEVTFEDDGNGNVTLSNVTSFGNAEGGAY